MSYTKLKELIQSNPDYLSMTEEEITDWCNEEASIALHETLPVSSVANVILGHKQDWLDLAEEERGFIKDFLAMHSGQDIVVPQEGTTARLALQNILNPQGRPYEQTSTMHKALLSTLAYPIKRCVNAGFSVVVVGDVQNALGD